MLGFERLGDSIDAALWTERDRSRVLAEERGRQAFVQRIAEIVASETFRLHPQVRRGLAAVATLAVHLHQESQYVFCNLAVLECLSPLPGGLEDKAGWSVGWFYEDRSTSETPVTLFEFGYQVC